MTHEENYLAWLKDAHAMEKQAESMLEKMASRLEHYPDLKARIQQHIEETRQQQTLLQSVIDRNDTSRSAFKDAMGKLSAMGGILADDEVVKGAISGYVFEQFEIANYTSLIAAAQLVGDQEGVRIFEQIREQEIAMAEWCLTHLPDVTQQFMTRDAAEDVEAKK